MPVDLEIAGGMSIAPMLGSGGRYPYRIASAFGSDSKRSVGRSESIVRSNRPNDADHKCRRRQGSKTLSLLAPDAM